VTNDLVHFIQFFHAFWEIGRHSPGLLHDIANPLTTATTALEIVLHDAETNLQYNPVSLQEITVSLECLQHIQAMIKHNPIRRSIPSMHSFSIRQELGTVMRLYQWKCQQKKARIKLNVTPDLQLRGNPIRFRQMVGNLISNAVDVSDLILIHARRTQHTITITIQDHGPGISSQVLQHIFTPFFTTKSAAHGSGLGLSIVKEIAEKEFKGKVSVRSQVGKGTTFVLMLPDK
jgi:signal transduction histidine kinase